MRQGVLLEVLKVKKPQACGFGADSITNVLTAGHLLLLIDSASHIIGTFIIVVAV